MIVDIRWISITWADRRRLPGIVSADMGGDGLITGVIRRGYLFMEISNSSWPGVLRVLCLPDMAQRNRHPASTAGSIIRAKLFVRAPLLAS